MTVSLNMFNFLYLLAPVVSAVEGAEVGVVVGATAGEINQN